MSQQIVLHETTNLIEVFIENRAICTHNSPTLYTATLGITGHIVPGRNNTLWSCGNEGWSFSPADPYCSLIVWTDANGVVVGYGSPLTVSPITSTSYTASVTYFNCPVGFILSDVVNIPGFVDLELTQTMSNVPAYPGNNGTYSFTVTNHGNVPVTQVKVQSDIPCGSYVSHVSSPNNVPPPVAGLYTIPTIPPGGSRTVTVTFLYTTATTACPVCSHVTGYNEMVEYPDCNPNNEADCDIIPPLPVNIQVLKTLNSGGDLYGVATFTISVINTSNNIASNVVLQEIVPNCLANVVINPPAGATVNGNTITIPTVPANNAANPITFTVTGTYIDGTTECTNCVQFVPSQGQADTNPNDNYACATIPHIETDIAVSKLLKSQNLVTGTVTFEIAVTNLGNVTASDVILHDVWEAGCFTYQSAFLPKPGSTITVTTVPAQVSASADIYLQDVLAGATEYFQITYHKDVFCADCENCVSFDHFNGIDLNPNNNTMCVTLPANIPANALTISGAPNSIVDMTIDYNGTFGNPLLIMVEPFVTWHVQGTRWLNFCEVILQEGARIDIPVEASLHINHSHLHGCTLMWDEINVQKGGHLIAGTSQIEDAHYAVHLQIGGDAVLRGCHFKRNYVGVYIQPSPSIRYLDNTTTSAFGDRLFLLRDTFSCQTPMLPPYTGQIAAFGDAAPNRAYSFAGMYMQDVVYIFANPNTSPLLYHNVTYTHLNNGIVAYRSDLTVQYQYFESMQPYDQPYPGTYMGWNDYDGSAVYTRGKKKLGYLHFKGYGKMSPASMVGVKYGIYSHQMKWTEVENTHIGSGTVGVNILGTYLGAHWIHDNGFNCGSFGVYSSFNDQSTTEINDNYLNMNAAFLASPGGQYLNSSAGIAGFDFVPTTLAVHDNEIDLNDCSGGIVSFVTQQGTSVKNNIVNMNGANSAMGIFSVYSSEIDIECNQVLGDYGAGYGMIACGDATMACNQAVNTPYGFAFSDICTNMDFKGNYMKDNPQYGLYLDYSAQLGHQWDKGNIWDGVFPNFAAFYNLASPTWIFKVDALNYPIQDPNPRYPASGWFYQTPANTPYYECTNNSNCNAGGISIVGQGGTSMEERIATDSLNAPLYPEEQQREASAYLYDKLRDDSLLRVSSAEMSDFYDEKMETNIKDFSDVKKGIANLISDSLNISLNNNNAAINAIKAQIASQDSLLQYAASLNDSLTILLAKQPLYAQISVIDSVIRLIANGIDSLQIVQSTNVIASNNAIATTRQMEDNEKNVNDIYLSTIGKDIYHLDSTQIALLETIIYQCPLAGGSAVYKARSLYTLHKVQFLYDDYENCNLVNMQWRQGQAHPQVLSNLLETLQVYPNPTEGNITFDFGAPIKETKMLYLYNTQGQIVLSQTISVEVQKFSTSLSQLASGMYFYRVQGLSNTITGKIIIE